MERKEFEDLFQKREQVGKNLLEILRQQGVDCQVKLTHFYV